MTETHHVFGTVAGTGAAITVSSEKCGFLPKQVVVTRITGEDAPVKVVWTEPMADAAGIKSVLDGTNSVISSGGITPSAGGFTIGTDGDLNVIGAVLLYEAIG